MVFPHPYTNSAYATDQYNLKVLYLEFFTPVSYIYTPHKPK